MAPLSYSDRLRDALLVLSRDTLADVTARHGLAVSDRRAAGAHAEAIARAGLTAGDILGGAKRSELFEALRGTTSLPFKPGKKVAVKVVDDRGNEVVKVVEGRP